MTKRAGAYIRVSSDRQDVQNQLPDLERHIQHQNWTLVETYADEGISGKTTSRPGFDRMMEDARAGKLDVIVCYKLDRIGRSVSHLYRTIEELRSLNVGFVCTTQNIDTSSPTGKLLFGVLALMAEFESDLISERTKSAMAVSRKVKHVGRPPIRIDLEEAGRLRRGFGFGYAARQIGVSESTLRRRLTA